MFVCAQRKPRGWGLYLSLPWGQPHLSLPNDHIPVFALLQDSEDHVSLQLVKYLWENQELGTSLIHLLDP